MSRKGISEHVKRKLWAESMGRCMNPECSMELLIENSNIMEIAHISPYCKTEDNSFENLIILCPNCHKKFDKVGILSADMVKSWKENRRREVEQFFCNEFKSFDDLKEKVIPLLNENHQIYTNYYRDVIDRRNWDKFEPKILLNNEKLKMLFENNLHLFQRHPDKSYSNLELICKFMVHVEEFKVTRGDEEKHRQVLFPKEIHSIFGLHPLSDRMIPSVEAVEELMKEYRDEGLLEKVEIGVEKPCILLKNKDIIYLDDAPRLSQIYHNNRCFRTAKVRIEALNFMLKYLRNNDIPFVFSNQDSLREIKINDTSIVFVYEYCLSKEFLHRLAPKCNCVIINLHNWNGVKCISKDALEFAEKLNVKLLTTDEFYGYVHGIS